MLVLLVLAAVFSCGEASLAGSRGMQSADPMNTIVLPEGLSLVLRMTTLLDTDRAKIGDSVEAVLLKDAKIHGTAVVPRNARIRGRISLLRREDRYVMVGLEWTELEFGNTKAPVVAKLIRVVTPLPGSERMEIPYDHYALRTDPIDETVIGGVIGGTNPILENKIPGLGIFVIRSPHFTCKNLEMVWRTLPQK